MINLELSFIIGAILFLVMVFLVFKLVKKVIFASLLIFLIFIIVNAGIGFLVYRDVMDIREKFSTSSKLVMLEDGGEIISAMQMQSFDEEGFNFLDEDWIAHKQELFEKRNYKEIIGRNYKMFVIKLETFSDIESIEMEEFVLTNQDIFNILQSDRPSDVFFEVYIKDMELGEMQKTLARQQFNEEIGQKNIKAMMLGLIFNKALEQEGPLFIINNFKDSNIIVYPETITFKIIKLVPKFAYELAYEKIIK